MDIELKNRKQGFGAIRRRRMDAPTADFFQSSTQLGDRVKKTGGAFAKAAYAAHVLKRHARTVGKAALFGTAAYAIHDTLKRRRMKMSNTLQLGLAGAGVTALKAFNHPATQYGGTALGVAGAIHLKRKMFPKKPKLSAHQQGVNDFANHIAKTRAPSGMTGRVNSLPNGKKSVTFHPSTSLSFEELTGKLDLMLSGLELAEGPLAHAAKVVTKRYGSTAKTGVLPAHHFAPAIATRSNRLAQQATMQAKVAGSRFGNAGRALGRFARQKPRLAAGLAGGTAGLAIGAGAVGAIAAHAIGKKVFGRKTVAASNEPLELSAFDRFKAKLEAKGMSAKEAGGTAYNDGKKKYGKAGMEEKSIAGRKKLKALAASNDDSVNYASDCLVLDALSRSPKG